MANITDGKFAAAVNAGALRTIGSGGMKADVFAKEIGHMQTDSLAVNLIMFRSDIMSLLRLCAGRRFRKVIAGAGSNGPYGVIAGIKVMPVIIAASD